MEIKDLIHKKLNLIIYYNENNNNLPMFENVINYHDEEITFYQSVENKFLFFLNNENLSFDINNFKLFEIMYMEELEKYFKRYKIDYKYIDIIKEQIFNNSKL